MAEQLHDDRQRYPLFIEVHGFGFPQHVAVQFLRDRRAPFSGEVTSFGEHHGDGFTGKGGCLAAVVTVEERTRNGLGGTLRVEFLEIDQKVFDCLANSHLANSA